jgi:hypothetical protein
MAHGIVRAHAFGGVVREQFSRRLWDPAWPAWPGQILFVPQQQIGRVVVSLSLRAYRRAYAGRQWLARSIPTGRVLAAAQAVITSVQRVERFAQSRILYQRPDPPPRPRKVRLIAERRPERPRRIPDSPRIDVDPPPRRRERPAAQTLGRNLYSRWDRH